MGSGVDDKFVRKIYARLGYHDKKQKIERVRESLMGVRGGEQRR